MVNGKRANREKWINFVACVRGRQGFSRVFRASVVGPPTRSVVSEVKHRLFGKGTVAFSLCQTVPSSVLYPDVLFSLHGNIFRQHSPTRNGTALGRLVLEKYQVSPTSARFPVTITQAQPPGPWCARRWVSSRVRGGYSAPAPSRDIETEELHPWRSSGGELWSV